jgi:chromosome segregation ATPase
MSSGLETLRSIDEALAQAKSQSLDLSEKLQVASAERMAAERTVAEHYRSLARVRVSDLAQGKMLSALDAAERRAQALMERRTGELAGLQQEQTDARLQTQELEAKRAAQSDALARLGEELDSLEADVQQRLAADDAYQMQLSATQQAEARARRAERKTELAVSDRAEKGAPYEDDPLFMYLWRRGFATSGYRASAPIRFLDTWVARLCHYHDARPNYSLLLELPKRLEAHTERVRAEADRQLDALRKLEQGAAHDSAVDATQEKLDEAAGALGDLDQSIDEIDSKLRELEQRQVAFAAGHDPTAREATDSVAASLRETGLSSLMREARQTPTDADDRIVEQLADAQQQASELQQELEQERRLLASLNGRVKQLEQIRQEFRRRRFDSGNSGFSKGTLIAVMLGQFMNGLMNSRDLWATIERQQRWQRRRADPAFGSGSIKPGGGVWSGGLPRGRGGFGGGGFGTGGGFGGGGGFKTGGGF